LRAKKKKRNATRARQRRVLQREKVNPHNGRGSRFNTGKGWQRENRIGTASKLSKLSLTKLGGGGGGQQKNQ